MRDDVRIACTGRIRRHVESWGALGAHALLECTIDVYGAQCAPPRRASCALHGYSTVTPWSLHGACYSENHVTDPDERHAARCYSSSACKYSFDMASHCASDAPNHVAWVCAWARRGEARRAWSAMGGEARRVASADGSSTSSPPRCKARITRL